MTKVFASAVFLAMLVAAPVDRASGDLLGHLCIDPWIIDAGGTKGDGLVTVRSRCADPIVVTLSGKKGLKDIGTILPGVTRSLYFKISKNETITIVGTGLGDYDGEIAVK